MDYTNSTTDYRILYPGSNAVIPNVEHAKVPRVTEKGGTAPAAAIHLMPPNVCAALDNFQNAGGPPALVAPPLGVGGIDAADVLFDFTEKLNLGIYGAESSNDRGTATGKSQSFTVNPAAVLTSIDVDYLTQGPIMPKSLKNINNFFENKRRTGREITREDAIGLADEVDDFIDEAAARGDIDTQHKEMLQNNLTEIRRNALGDGGTLTTAEIMTLVALVLTRAAQNANEMRQLESQASLENITQSLQLSLKAAQKKESAAEHQYKASMYNAAGQMVSGICDMLGGGAQGLMAKFGPGEGATKAAFSQAGGQFLRGLGASIDAGIRMLGAAEQLKSASDLAASDVFQAYAGQSQAIGNRAQGSAQDQGQTLRSLLDTLNSIANSMTQTTSAIAQSIK